MFGKTDKLMKTTQPVFENVIKRADELKMLLERKNQLPIAIVEFISNEVERIKHDLAAFVHLWKIGSVPASRMFENQSRLSEVIFDIDKKLRYHKDRGDRDRLKSFFYPELVKDTSEAMSIEVFAGFEPLHHIHKDGTERVHIFESGGDGCLLSDHANDRRRRSLNVVIAIAEDILHHVYHDSEEADKLDVSIRNEMSILGFYCPNGWTVKDGAGKLHRYRARSIIPPKYFESLIYKNIMPTLGSGEQVKVRIYSGGIISEEYKKAFKVSREFGIKFFDGEEIRDTLVLEETDGENSELFVRKMNKVISLMDQFYYEAFDMHPNINMQIEVDFDKRGLLCPTNFVFVEPAYEDRWAL
ncbi:hypothetical protein [Paenibacillus periandrae]|uniref:hypothetical protein n=1 Tax=Paenibacillus periandrae TaxID=1761741 RepID=UPI001F0A02FD|nr:hypothetical protein [Paenibacillus periandrae]